MNMKIQKIKLKENIKICPEKENQPNISLVILIFLNGIFQNSTFKLFEGNTDYKKI